MPHKDPAARREYIKKYNNRWRRLHPERTKELTRRSRLKTLFGISEQQYDAMVEAQSGVCAICQQPDPAGRLLAVDHNHTTGVVRGLLCTRCNPALGYVRDSQEILRAMIVYLEHHESTNRSV